MKFDHINVTHTVLNIVATIPLNFINWISRSLARGKSKANYLYGIQAYHLRPWGMEQTELICRYLELNFKR